MRPSKFFSSTPKKTRLLNQSWRKPIADFLIYRPNFHSITNFKKSVQYETDVGLHSTTLKMHTGSLEKNCGQIAKIQCSWAPATYY